MGIYWQELEAGASTTEGATVARDNGMKSRDRVAGMPPEQAFRDVFAAALKVTNITQEELARRIGRSGAAVSQWLNRGDIPDLAVVFKLEDALNLRLGTLVQHHSPDVWVIIETKSKITWESLGWEKKLEETLIEAPITNRQREITRDTLHGYVEINLLRQKSSPSDS